MKIPFAVQIDTGTLIEVGDVAPGRECRCICPSCNQGVLARQGNINAWHFAHDKQSPYPPKTLCDISFYSCCRSYVIELVKQGLVKRIMTPNYLLEEFDGLSGISVSDLVTSSRVVDVSSIKEHSKYDLLAKVENHNLYIHLDYEGRPYPSIPDNSGLLLVDLTFIGIEFNVRESAPGGIRKIILDLFERCSDYKCWLYHPNEETVRQRLKENLIDKLADELITKDDVYSNSNSDGRHNNPDCLPKKIDGLYSCIMCSSEWIGVEGINAYCEKCRTHLFSKFLPSL